MTITTAAIRKAALKAAIRAEIRKPVPATMCPDYRDIRGQPLDLVAVFGRSGR